MGIGGVLYEGNSELFTGPLGVVQIAFEGYDLGKTTADATLVPDKNEKDIMYQQEGTKAADHVRTGMEYVLNATFGEIKTGLLKLLMAGVTSVEDGSFDSGILERELFKSMRTNEAGPMKVAAVDENGIAKADLEDILNFYEVIPIIPGDLINWGVDTQRNLPVEFRIKWYKFPVPPGSLLGAYGYWGDPSIETEAYDIANIWPNVDAPKIVSAVATAATTMLVTFDENIFHQVADAFQVASCVAFCQEADGTPHPTLPGFNIASAGEITDKVLTLTFAALTFATGYIIKLSITKECLQDVIFSASDENKFGGVYDYPVEEAVV